MTQRRGTTLIELILCMMAGSGVMLLAISLVHQSLSLSEISRTRADNNRTLDQLAHCFRCDMHAASAWEIEAQGSLVLTFPDTSKVEYTSQNHTVFREHKRNDNALERDCYALGEDASANFVPMQDPVRVSLVVSSSKGLTGGESQRAKERLDLMVECEPGRWQHLERSDLERNDLERNDLEHDNGDQP